METILADLQKDLMELRHHLALTEDAIDRACDAMEGWDLETPSSAYLDKQINRAKDSNANAKSLHMKIIDVVDDLVLAGTAGGKAVASRRS